MIQKSCLWLLLLSTCFLLSNRMIRAQEAGLPQEASPGLSSTLNNDAAGTAEDRLHRETPPQTVLDFTNHAAQIVFLVFIGLFLSTYMFIRRKPSQGKKKKKIKF